MPNQSSQGGRNRRNLLAGGKSLGATVGLVVGLIAAIALTVAAAFAQSPAAPVVEAAATVPKTQVIVLGMIHGGHRTSAVYSIEVVQRVIRAVDPDYVLTEIPPDRLAAAAAEFARDGKITEPRVRVFPEYVEALFPLSSSMKFKIIPTAAWSAGMNATRGAALRRLEADPARAADWRAYQAGLDEMRNAIGDRGDDPHFIHSAAYDEIIRRGYQPYATLFAKDLGRGDWEQINKDHYRLIEAALDFHAGEGARVLITFGSAHKYWFLEQLRKRPDIELIDPRGFFGADAP